jgi:ACT domain-containing protein
MKKDHPILTVIGEDKRGIVAQISTALWNEKINIEEIRQGIIEGKFFMVMSIDISGASLSFQEIEEKLKQAGNQAGVEISLYNQSIFSAMHKI